jgi:hypothetical protein
MSVSSSWPSSALVLAAARRDARTGFRDMRLPTRGPARSGGHTSSTTALLSMSFPARRCSAPSASDWKSAFGKLCSKTMVCGIWTPSFIALSAAPPPPRPFHSTAVKCVSGVSTKGCVDIADGVSLFVRRLPTRQPDGV